MYPGMMGVGMGMGGMGMGYPYGMMASNPYMYSGMVSSSLHRVSSPRSTVLATDPSA